MVARTLSSSMTKLGNLDTRHRTIVLSPTASIFAQRVRTDISKLGLQLPRQ